MSRLTDEEIRKMPLNEADIYLETHPDEAQHFAKVHIPESKSHVHGDFEPGCRRK